jgi:predicted ATPase
MKKITKRNVGDHVDLIIELAEKVKLGEVTILTGSNGTGKSFIRKIVGFKLAEKKGGDKTKTFVSQTSMEQRTGTNADWGALSGIMRDVGWTPTSTETLGKIQNLMDDRFKDRYIVIDEPEIGMGEETVLGLVEYLNERLEELRKGNFLGVMIITHSRLIVEHLKADSFINIDGLSREQWLTRKLVPTDLKDLEERSLIIHSEIQQRINKAEKEMA